MRIQALRVERRRLLSPMIVLALCVSAILGLLVSSTSDRMDTAGRDLVNDATSVRTLATFPHDPIYILGNTGFTNESGVVWGSGTAADPYVIDSWEIDAGGQYGIVVMDADAHFIIRNATVYNASGGIVVVFSSNGTVSHCTVSNTSDAIVIGGSRNKAYDNEVTSCHFGFLIEDEDNLAIDNTVRFADNEGIYIVGQNHTISGNHIESCNRGIRTNTARNISVRDNNCSMNDVGIRLDSSSGIILLNNTCNANEMEGIWIDASDNNTLTNNSSSNNEYGILLTQSSGNALNNNTCVSNTGYGLFLYDLSDNNILNNNNCSYNGLDGIYIALSEGNTLVSNTCNANARSGAYLFSSNGCSLFNNTCNMNVGAGLDFSNSVGLNVINNVCSLNIGDGILLESLYSSSLTYNSVYSNNHSGIHVWFSTDNYISSNNCSSNWYMGVYIEYSPENTITLNQLWSNLGYGVCIGSGSGNRIWNNTFGGNNGAGSTYDPNHVQARDDRTGNWWNGTNGFGNYWSDWTVPDANMDGIVDTPYNITGSAGAKDYYPLTTIPTEPIPEFSMMPLVVLVLLMAIGSTAGTRRRKT